MLGKCTRSSDEARLKNIGSPFKSSPHREREKEGTRTFGGTNVPESLGIGEIKNKGLREERKVGLDIKQNLRFTQGLGRPWKKTRN